jgi:thioredoxin 1
MVKEVNEAAFAAEVLESEKPVLVDFWAPWCGPCRMVSPVVEAVGTKLADSLKTVKVNTDENMSISSEYQITGIPSLLVFKGGKEVDRFVGFLPQEQLEAKLQSYL